MEKKHELAPGFPKHMHHPAYEPAVNGYAMGEGKAARFPPVQVYTQDMEDYHSAMGYVVGPAPNLHAENFEEFPKWMHKEGSDPVLVQTESEAKLMEKAGYKAPANTSAAAVVEAAKQKAPYQEFPKWIHGEGVKSELAHSQEEEDRIRRKFAAVTGKPVASKAPAASAPPPAEVKKPAAVKVAPVKVTPKPAKEIPPRRSRKPVAETTTAPAEDGWPPAGSD